MKTLRTFRPALAAWLIAVAMLVSAPRPLPADEPTKQGSISKLIKSVLPGNALAGRETAKPGITSSDAGQILVPPKLAKLHPVAILISRDEAGKRLKALESAAKVSGIIVVAPEYRQEDGAFDPDATLEAFDALLKRIHAEQKVATAKLFLLAEGDNAGPAWRLALAGASRLAGCALVNPAACEIEAEQLEKLKELNFVLLAGADKKVREQARQTLEKLHKAKIANARLRKLDAEGDDATTEALATALRWVRAAAGADQDDDEKSDKLAGDLPGARKLYMKGKYDLAISSYQALQAQDALTVRAATGLARALSAVGRYSEALEAAQAVADKAKDDAAWRLVMAESLSHLGRYEEALKHALVARELRPLWAPAVLVAGNLQETLGQPDKALATYKAMEEITFSDTHRNDAPSLVALGRIFDRYTILRGTKASIQATNILHNYLQEAYQKVDKDYWPAHVAAGMFLLSKHRADQANTEFALALKKNPKCADAYAGAAMAALEGWQFERCIAAADKALEINPKHADALLAKANCMMLWRKFDDAIPIAEKVLEFNPNHLDALSLLAAVHVRQRNEQQAAQYAQRVEAVNDRYYGLPLAIAEWLSAGRQYDQAETYYRRAIEMAPKMAEPLAGLGKMYMQTGEEGKALDILVQAHELDDFRSDVANFLAICRRILDPDRFVVRETDNFIIKVDKQYDLVMLEQMAEYMESIYEEVCGDFAHYPPEKTIIEIMPTHQQFSLRIAGRGWIGTVGACTGRVIVLAAPHLERSQLGLHNWAMVMRHEYTHTVTLSATNNNIPHWFTEACAVWQQPDKENYRYISMLVQAVRSDRLFTVKEIDWGFIRPKRSGDRSLAYAQAQWMMEYIISEHGFTKITDMLKAFGDGLTQQEVFDTVLGVSQESFDEQFRAWARRQVIDWGFEPDGPMDLKEAKELAEKNKVDAEAQARYAESLLAKGKGKQALEAAKNALKLDKANVTARRVRARVFIARKQYDKAMEAAEELQQADPDSALASRIMAVAYIAKRKFVLAIDPLEQLKVLQPLDSFSYEKLAEIYTQLGQPEKALPNLLHLHRHTMRDPRYARQIAEIYRLLDRDDLAEKYFQEVTYINPYESTAYRSIASLQVRQKQYGEALETANRLVLLEPDAAKSWDYLAQIRYRKARRDNDRQLMLEAREAARKSIDLDPNGLGARILSAIESQLETMPAGGA
jgi:tetratricopeptide (TPR) repeat protein